MLPIITLPPAPPVVYDSPEYHALKALHEAKDEESSKLYSEYQQLDRSADNASLSTRDAKKRKAKKKYDQWSAVDKEATSLKFQVIRIDQHHWARNHPEPLVRFRVSIAVAGLYNRDPFTSHCSVKTDNPESVAVDAFLRKTFTPLVQPDELEEAVRSYLYFNAEGGWDHLGQRAFDWAVELATWPRWKADKLMQVDLLSPISDEDRARVRRQIEDVKYASEKPKVEEILAGGRHISAMWANQLKAKRDNEADKRLNMPTFVQQCIIELLRRGEASNEKLSTHVFAACKEKWGTLDKADANCAVTVADTMLTEGAITRRRITRKGVSINYFKLAEQPAKETAPCPSSSSPTPS